MCRWVLYYGETEVLLADVILTPEHALFAQAKHAGLALAQWGEPLKHLRSVVNWVARNQKLNGDGSGFGFFLTFPKQV
jgi:predicted glutamine amidotransferase